MPESGKVGGFLQVREGEEKTAREVSFLAGSESSEYLKTGTTIVGLCCKSFVVLAADTRSTSGALVMDKEKLKVHPLAPRIFACAAGTSADCTQISRKVGQVLAMQRLYREVSGITPTPTGDRILAARSAILDSLLDKKSTGGRDPSAVFLLGGVDNDGPALYQVEGGGATQRAQYAALGSGSLDAIAVMESMISAALKRTRDQVEEKETDEKDDGGSLREWRESKKRRYHLDVDRDEAIMIVRKAVQAGILNDLGSGSHVDICVIEAAEVRQWREELRTAHERMMAGRAGEIDETPQSLDAETLVKDSDLTWMRPPPSFTNDLLPIGVSVDII